MTVQRHRSPHSISVQQLRSPFHHTSNPTILVRAADVVVFDRQDHSTNSTEGKCRREKKLRRNTSNDQTNGFFYENRTFYVFFPSNFPLFLTTLSLVLSCFLEKILLLEIYKLFLWQSVCCNLNIDFSFTSAHTHTHTCEQTHTQVEWMEHGRGITKRKTKWIQQEIFILF